MTGTTTTKTMSEEPLQHRFAKFAPDQTDGTYYIRSSRIPRRCLVVICSQLLVHSTATILETRCFRQYTS